LAETAKVAEGVIAAARLEIFIVLAPDLALSQVIRGIVYILPEGESTEFFRLSGRTQAGGI
jgi:hypothetical protein